jgi:DNA-binding transcriptional MerR regulator/methylmalonyl-CoA mutase cobalamin-binding subunit
MTEDDKYVEPWHPIRVAALRTGLTPDVLRVWERRYEVVAPRRSEGGQRLYCDSDIERLTLLRRVTEAGRSISQVAGLGTEELAALLRADEEARAEAVPGTAHEPAAAVAKGYLKSATAAVEALESRRLQVVLGQAALGLGSEQFVDLVLAPLLRAIGESWHAGAITPAHEHAATEVVRRVLEWMAGAFEAPIDAPRMIVTTPAGDQHELGALLVGVVAATEGWRVSQLGPDLPAAAVAAAALQTGASVVAISAVYRPASDGLLEHLAAVRSELPDRIELVVGGAATAALEQRIAAVGARQLPTLVDLRDFLRSLGATPGAPA